jgi:hypothetical protein
MCPIMGSPFGPGGRGYGVDLDEERHAIKMNVTRLIERAARPLPEGMSTISQQFSREAPSRDNVFGMFLAQHSLYNVSRFQKSYRGPEGSNCQARGTRTKEYRIRNLTTTA